MKHKNSVTRVQRVQSVKRMKSVIRVKSVKIATKRNRAIKTTECEDYLQSKGNKEESEGSEIEQSV